MSVLGNLIVRITGDNKELKNTIAGSEKQLSGFGATVQKHSATFMKTGAVMMGFAGAIAITAIKVGKEFDAAYKKIRTGTGATGKVLEGLKKDFRAVAKDVPNSLDEVSTAIADINTRLGLTGKPLQAMAKQMLNLARITETDVNAVIRTSTRLFGDWDVAVEDQAETLDYLYKVSQQTGIGIDRLSDIVTTYGVQMRASGFDMETSIALLGKWEKEGVSAEKMLGGLSMALGRFAKAGLEPEEALRDLMVQIEKAPTVGEAMGLAVEALGTRAGPDFALAVREGRFAVEDLMETLDANTDTINQAALDTMTLTEMFDLLKNRGKLAIEPLARSVTEELLPVLEKVTDKLGDLDEETLDNIASYALWAIKIIGVGGAFIFAMGAVAKFTTAIKTATGALTTMHAAAWGPLALVALPAIAGGIAKVRHETIEAEEKIVDMDSAIRDITENLGTFQGRMYGANKELEDNLLELKKISEEYPGVSEKVQQLAKDFDNEKITAEELLKELKELIKNKAEYKEVIDEATKGTLGFAKALSPATQGVKSIEKAVEDWKDETEEAAEATDNLSDEIDGLRSSFNKLIGVLFDGIDVSNNLQEAEWKVADVEAELIKLREEGKEGTREYEEKVNDLDDANKDLINSLFEVYTSTKISREEQQKAKTDALEYGRQMVETGQWGEQSFIELENQFDESARGIKSDIDNVVIPAYLLMQTKGQQISDQVIDPEIKADTGTAMTHLSGYLTALGRIPEKKTTTIETKYTTVGRPPPGAGMYAGGGIAGFARGGITGSDGFSLPILTAAQGLITPSFDNGGILALLHKKEVVLNSGQQLNLAKLIFGLAEGKYGVKGGGDINNYFNIAELVVREEADIHRIAEDLYDLQQTKQRGAGYK